MTPSPTGEHQGLLGKLLTWLDRHWAEPTGGLIYLQLNVAEAEAWPGNYRIPDLSLLTPARFDAYRDLYINGGPDVVVEIRSPDDESYEKLPFYAKIGVREVWIIDRDSKRPELYELIDIELRACEPNYDGWFSSTVTGVQLQQGDDGKLVIQMANHPETLARLP